MNITSPTNAAVSPLRRLALIAVVVAGLAGILPVQAGWSKSPDPDDHRGSVVLLDFWASWCAPCRRSFPWMDEMQQKYGADGFVVIAVNLDNERSEAERFLAEYEPGFTIAYDDARDLARRYGVDSMPNSFLIDRNGAVRAEHKGFRIADAERYEAAIVSVLGEAKADE